MMPQLEAELAASDGSAGGIGADATASPHGMPRYRGVNWNAACKKWEVKWRNPATRKPQHGGYFAVGQEEAAARRYDAMARAHGDTVVNFPDERAGETQAHAGERSAQPRGASNFRGVTATTAKGNRFQAYVRVAGTSAHSQPQRMRRERSTAARESWVGQLRDSTFRMRRTCRRRCRCLRLGRIANPLAQAASEA
jgi:hypothetical protein